jgi:hypothetical protein
MKKVILRPICALQTSVFSVSRGSDSSLMRSPRQEPLPYFNTQISFSMLKNAPTVRLSLAVIAALFCCIRFSHAQILSASPGPNSSSLARFAEAPVGLNTGVPDISLPLYNIQSSKLSYPLSISYHASGIRVDDIASPVGLGWSLNSGGIITRVMRGRADEQPNCFFAFAGSVPDANGTINDITKENLAEGTYDMMPDLFYYNIGIGAGKIIFDDQLLPRTIPKSDLKVTTNSTSSLSNFTLTTSDGTNYEFESGESSTVQTPNGGPAFTSTWYLARIVSVDKVDTIRFNYTPSSVYSYTSSESSSLKFFYNAPVGASRANHEVSVQNAAGITTSVTGTRYLTSIESKTEKLQFNFSAGRTDYAASKKLDNLVIYYRDPITGAFVERKKINFNYSYFLNTDNSTRLRLDNVQEQYGTLYDPPTAFNYSANVLPPPGSSAVDLWGYYNGATSNTNRIPAMTWEGVELSTSDRTIHSAYVDGFMLNKITTPLGGITEFYFEPNRYSNGASQLDGPGLRIQKIIKRDPYSNISATTNYAYTNPATGLSSGVLVYKPNFYTDIPVKDLAHGTVLTYNCLLIMVNGIALGNFSGPPLIYEYVTVFNGDDENVSGKTTSKFSLYSQLPVIDYPFFPVQDDSWLAGNVLSQDSYKVESGTATPVTSVSYRYAISPGYQTFKGLLVAYNKLMINGPPIVNSDYNISNFYSYSKFQFCDQKISKNFEQNSGTVLSTQTENYFHDSNVHTLLTKMETTTSEASTIFRKQFTYPQDYAATGVIGVMQNLNMTGFPIEVVTSRVDNGTEYVTGYEKSDYNEWFTAKVYPRYTYRPLLSSKILKSTFDANRAGYLKLASVINQYDLTGHAVESQPVGDEPSAIIFDRYANNVVASVTPAKASQIAYTSFESTDFGQWTVTAGTQNKTKTISLGLSTTFKSFEIMTDQVITYTYSVVRDVGASPLLIFTKPGVTPIQRALTGTTGTGTVSLTTGAWTVSVSYESNVQSLGASFSYQAVVQLPVNITNVFKTGQHALSFTASTVISRTSLPPGDYILSYYQQAGIGAPTVTVTGSAQILSTIQDPVGADMSKLITKKIRINALTDAVRLSGSSGVIDELRLYPVGSLMKTICYDAMGRVQTVTDQNLRSQFYFYDERGRIKLIRDHDQAIVQQYEYKIGGN